MKIASFILTPVQHTRRSERRKRMPEKRREEERSLFSPLGKSQKQRATTVPGAEHDQQRDLKDTDEDNKKNLNCLSFFVSASVFFSSSVSSSIAFVITGLDSLSFPALRSFIARYFIPASRAFHVIHLSVHTPSTGYWRSSERAVQEKTNFRLSALSLFCFRTSFFPLPPLVFSVSFIFGLPGRPLREGCFPRLGLRSSRKEEASDVASLSAGVCLRCNS